MVQRGRSENAIDGKTDIMNGKMSLVSINIWKKKERVPQVRDWQNIAPLRKQPRMAILYIANLMLQQMTGFCRSELAVVPACSQRPLPGLTGRRDRIGMKREEIKSELTGIKRSLVVTLGFLHCMATWFANVIAMPSGERERERGGGGYQPRAYNGVMV